MPLNMHASDDAEAEDFLEIQAPVSLGSWQDYFDEHFIESTERGTFSIYTAGLEMDQEQTVLLCHHGAGYTALTFASLAQVMRRRHPGIAVIGVDARAHGQSDGLAKDLSLSTLVDDFVHVTRILTSRWTAEHTLIGVGHSLGGSVITWIAQQSLLPLAGIIIVDIVEEAALLALSSMENVLRARPSRFSHPSDAVTWAIVSHTSRHPPSAAISIPSQIEWDARLGEWRWRTDLMAAQGHWEGWFKGLSKAFVEVRTAKLLVLAEREYLDRTLMVASMQGKFQCAIVRGTGHAIQEDRPCELADLVGPFVDRVIFVERLNHARGVIQR